MSLNIHIAVPFVKTLQGARHGRHVWQSVNNDTAYELEGLLNELFGVNVSLMADENPDTGQALQHMALAFDRAQRVMNYTLGNILDGDARRRIKEFKRALSDAHGIEPTQHKVLLRVTEQLLNAVVLGKLAATTRGDVVLGTLVEVTVAETDEPIAWSSDEFDVFISYTHRLRSAAALALRDQLAARGLKVWLDRDQLSIATGVRLQNIQIRRKLRHALAVSRHTVFFQTLGEMHADADFRGEHTAYNWQSFEQRYARDLIYVDRSGDLTIHYGSSQTAIPAHAALDFLTQRCREPSNPPQRSDFGPIAGRDPDLDESASELSAYLNPAFGREIEPSPLAEIALLAPGSAKTGRTEAAYGDDVLIQLLRYDAASALELQRAGLDLYWVFAVGSKLNDQRWQRPREYLVADVFGLEPGSAHDRIRRTGALTTGDLLLGLLEFAAGNTYARDLLKHACRAGRTDLTEQAVAHLVDECRTRAMESLRGDASRLGLHGWMFTHAAGGVRAMPVVECGTIQSTDIRPSRLLARQSARLFPPEVLAAFGNALTSRRADDVTQALATHKEIARTLSGVVTIGLSQDVSRPGDQGQSWLLDAEPEVQIASETTVECLLSALDTLSQHQASVPSPQQWPWGERPWQHGVFVGPATHGIATELSAFDLIADVLQPLDAYMALRTLEYDDF
jgi:hypothetical protein